MFSNPLPVYENQTLYPGVEFWVDMSSVQTISITQTSGTGFDQSIRFPVTFPTNSSYTFVVQAVCLDFNRNVTASPGMLIHY